MKKQTIADKMAKKTFFSDTIQKSWRIHSQAFGPILEPAFAEDYVARTHLCAALNFISNRDLQKGLKKLQLLQDRLETDADRAAWLFFMGLCFDMAGVQEAMLDFYQQAAQYGHRFYLPYLKVAKAAYVDGAHEAAETNFKAAIDCLREGAQDPQTPVILASAYINYAGSLTMMHRFEEAFAMLAESEKLMPVFPGRCGTYAPLLAATGDLARAETELEKLQTEGPGLYPAVKKVVEDIAAGVHPHFFPKEVDGEAVSAFWTWFGENAENFRAAVEQDKHDEVFAAVQPKLRELFPFVERDPDFALQRTETGVKLFLADYFMVALRNGCEQLLEACPGELKEAWEFEIVH